MTRLVLLIAASLLSSAALAQTKGNTKQECTRRCLTWDLDKTGLVAIVPYNERLKQIREKKEVETDPVKRKALEEAESDQLERRQDELENVCRKICAPLREE